jgi:hypothetical protein
MKKEKRLYFFSFVFLSFYHSILAKFSFLSWGQVVFIMGSGRTLGH